MLSFGSEYCTEANEGTGDSDSERDCGDVRLTRVKTASNENSTRTTGNVTDAAIADVSHVTSVYDVTR